MKREYIAQLESTPALIESVTSYSGYEQGRIDIDCVSREPLPQEFIDTIIHGDIKIKAKFYRRQELGRCGHCWTRLTGWTI